MTTVSAQRLATIFVEVADTLVDEFDLLDFLHMLTDRAATLVDAAAVGILLADSRATLQFMAGSNENVKLLELFQLQTKEGPCLEAFRSVRPVINVDLGAAGDRWRRSRSASRRASPPRRRSRRQDWRGRSRRGASPGARA